MAFAITHRVSGGSGTDATTYTTASISVDAGDLLLVAYTNGIGAGVATAVSGITGTLGSTLTFTNQASATMNATDAARTTILTAPITTTASGTLIFAHSGVTQSSGQWTICTVTGANNFSPLVRFQTGQYAGATTVMTMSPAPLATSMVFACGHTNSATALTAGGTGYTFIGNGTSATSPTVIHGCEYDLTAPSATVGFTHTGTLNRAIVGVELAPAVTVSSGIYYASTATAGRVQYDYGSNQTSGPVVMAQDFRMPTFSSTLEYLNGVLSLVSGGASQGDWRINVDRTVTIRNGASAATTSTEVLTANTWYHSEWKVDDPNNTQTLRIYIAGSTVPLLEISGTYTGVLTRVPHFGPAAAAAAGVLDMDNFQIANDWIVNGSGTVAASLNFNGLIEGSNLVTSGNWSIVGTTPVIRAASALDTAVLTGAGDLTGSGTAGTTENYTGSVSLSGSGALTLAGQPSVSRTLARTGSGTATYTGQSSTGEIVGSCHFEQNAPDLAFFFSDVGPGTPQTGDRAFLVWAHPSAVTPGSEPFKPTGFTYFGATSDNTAGASWWYRVLDGSESAIDMGLGATYMQSAILVVMRGYSAFNSLIYTTDAGTDAIHTAPGSIMDLSNLGVLIGNCERSASGGSTSMTPPAGFTKLVDSYHKTTSGVYNGVAYEGSGNKIISARAGGATHVPGDMTNNAAQSDVITWTLLMVPPNQGSPGLAGSSGLSGSGTLTASGTPGVVSNFTGSVALSGAGTLRGNQTLITTLDFEGTTEGANLSAATLPTGWTYNETGSGFASTTVAAAAKNGTRGNHLATTASTGTSYVKWDPAGNTNVATRRVISFYFRANTAFSGSTEFAVLKSTSGGTNCRFAFYPSTQLQFSLLGNTQVFITPKATVGVWYRIEMMVEGNVCELRAYNPDGSLFGSTTTAPTNQNTAVAWVGIVATSGSANANVDIDNVRYGNDWLDPIPSEATPLPLSGSGTLTLAGKPGVSGDTPLSGSGTLTLAGTPKGAGAITPNGTGTLTLAGIAKPAQTLLLSGSGILAFSGAKPAVSGSTTLSGVGLLNLSAGTNYSGFINLSGAGALTLAGKPAVSRTLALAGLGSLSTSAVAGMKATLALAGSGDFTPSKGHANTSTSLALSGAGALDLSGMVAGRSFRNLHGTLIKVKQPDESWDVLTSI